VHIVRSPLSVRTEFLQPYIWWKLRNTCFHTRIIISHIQIQFQ
jgi:hypothetical protein